VYILFVGDHLIRPHNTKQCNDHFISHSSFVSLTKHMDQLVSNSQLGGAAPQSGPEIKTTDDAAIYQKLPGTFSGFIKYTVLAIVFWHLVLFHLNISGISILMLDAAVVLWLFISFIMIRAVWSITYWDAAQSPFSKFCRWIFLTFVMASFLFVYFGFLFGVAPAPQF
jgi:hypothetical protein